MRSYLQVQRLWKALQSGLQCPFRASICVTTPEIVCADHKLSLLTLFPVALQQAEENS